MNKQDWYLNQLSITQYILRNPNAIKGEALISIAENIRLIIVSKSPLKEKIFYDILKAINISVDDYLVLSPTQLIMPIEQINHVVWFINEPVPETWQSSLQLKSKPIITSSSLSELASSPQQKRQLWHTLCQYEHYFKTI